MTPIYLSPIWLDIEKKNNYQVEIVIDTNGQKQINFYRFAAFSEQPATNRPHNWKAYASYRKIASNDKAAKSLAGILTAMRLRNSFKLEIYKNIICLGL